MSVQGALPVRAEELSPTPDRVRGWIAALPGWLLARVIVLLALVAAIWYRHGLPQTGNAPDAHGLFVWDSAWYRAIAEHGYGAFPRDAVRFFPLLPMVTAAVAWITPLGVGAALLVVCWVAAFGYAVLLFDLVRAEFGDVGVARRAAWLVQLVPGASVLVLGYTEALAGLLAVAYFRLLRSGRWGWLVPVGVASGLARPTGLLLALPALVSMRDRRASLPVRLAGAASPLLGTGAWLAWAGLRYGDPLLPYRVQTQTSLRGGLITNPLPYLFQPHADGMRLPANVLILIAGLVLLALCVRWLPAPYWLWTLALVGASVTAGQLHSLARYLAGAFPLVIVAAMLLRRRIAFIAALAVTLPVFAYIAFVSFGRYYIP